MKLSSIFDLVLTEATIKRDALNEVTLLMEKEIRVGDDLVSKLQSMKDNAFAKNVIAFLKSGNIKDDASVDYVDYKRKNEKLLTVGYTDREGKTKERLMRINKLMSYLGGDMTNVKPYEIEDVIGHLKKGEMDNLKLVSGNDILKVYHCENYDEGENMGSCMRFAAAQSYFGIYTKNPDKIKCLALFNPENGKVRGRALIFFMDDGKKFIDRAYVTNKQYMPEFNTYAEENGLVSHTSSNVTLSNGGEFSEYPFMDTFQYYHPESGTLSTNAEVGDGWLQLQDTSGGHSESGNWSDVHEEHIPEDQSVYIEHIEGYVYDTEVVQAWDEEDWLYRDSDDVVQIQAGEYKYGWALGRDTVKTHNGRIAIGEDVYEIECGDSFSEYAVEEDITTTVENLTALTDETVELTIGRYKGDRTVPENAYKITNGEEEAIMHADDFDYYMRDNPTAKPVQMEE